MDHKPLHPSAECLLAISLLVLTIAAAAFIAGCKGRDASSAANQNGHQTSVVGTPAPGWTRLTPSGEYPPPRWAVAAVYDPRLDRVFIFGDSTGPSAAGSSYLWVYDPASNKWSDLHPKNMPPFERDGAAMVYDPKADRLLLFGGMDANSDQMLNDLWAYYPSSNRWKSLPASGLLPPGRLASGGLVCLPSTGNLLLFGGQDGNGRPLGDTWEYDPAANRWTQLSPQGDLPSSRDGHAMAVDETTGCVLLFGGDPGVDVGFLNDVWSYDPKTEFWTQLKSPSDHSAASPQVRWQAAVAFDSRSRRLLMFGGDGPAGPFGDLWAYDPTDAGWTLLATGPSAGIGWSMVFDESRHALFAFSPSPASPWAFGLGSSDQP